MIGYRDKAWCVSPCATIECHRRLTPQIREEARKWATECGFIDVPIWQSDFRCAFFEEIKE